MAGGGWKKNFLSFIENLVGGKKIIPPSDLIGILIEHGFIKMEEADRFHRYVERSEYQVLSFVERSLNEMITADSILTTDPEDIRLEKILVGRINNLSTFIDIIEDVAKLLRERLTAEVFDRATANPNPTLGYVAWCLPDDPVEKEQKKQWWREHLPKKTLERTLFDMRSLDGTKECVYIPADAFTASPSRAESPEATMIGDLGTPLEVALRKRGNLKGKLSIPEYRYRVRQTIYLKILPAVDEGVKERRLNRSEADYLERFIFRIRYLMILYQGVKKGDIDMKSDQPLIPSITNIVSNKNIESHVEHLAKIGFDPARVNTIKAAAFNNQEKVKCINPDCENLFVPINKNHKHCEHCSKPGNYLKEWRKSKKNKNRRRKRNQPAPKESFPMIIIDPKSMEDE